MAEDQPDKKEITTGDIVYLKSDFNQTCPMTVEQVDGQVANCLRLDEGFRLKEHKILIHALQL